MRLSLILPALNEAAVITATLAALQPLRALGHEVILVYGGSTDGTPILAAPKVDRVITAPRGRAQSTDGTRWTAHGPLQGDLWTAPVPAGLPARHHYSCN